MKETEVGRIPFVLRIGITGHRPDKLPDPAAVEAKVSEAIDRAIGLLTEPRTFSERALRRLHGETKTPITLVGVTSLAEGSDRALARVILDRVGSKSDGHPLEVPLPRSERSYAEDFKTAHSRNEFRELLSRAQTLPAPPGRRTHEEGYFLAGMRVVDRCDVLIAVWDEQPAHGTGGTAEIIRFALEKRVPVVLVPSSGKGPLTVDDGTGPIPPAFAPCGAVRGNVPPSEGTPFDAKRIQFSFIEPYNRHSYAEGRFGLHIERERKSLPAPEGDVGVQLPLKALADWILPFFVRADVNALKAQKRHYALVWMEFLGAAAAVVAIAVQSTLFAEHPLYALAELLLLVGLLTVIVLGRRLGFHELWVSSRYLAERFRSAYFLAAVGLEQRRERGVEEALTLADPSEVWLADAFQYVWDRRPLVHVAEDDAPELRELILRAWLQDQIAYHESASVAHQKKLDGYRLVTLVLFFATFVVALLHTFVFHNHASNAAKAAIILAISLPAVGGAISGVAAQKQHRRHAQVYRSMHDLLASIIVGLTELESPTLAEVRERAAQAAEAMVGENVDWFGVMKLYDVEWHV